MRRAFVLLGFIGLVFALGALVAPVIYAVMQHVGTAVETNFNRVVSRTLLVFALLGLWPLAKLLGAMPKTLGLRFPIMRHVVIGCLVGFASLGAIFVIATLCDARELRASLTAAKLAKSVLLSVSAAIVVAPIEEILFRGVCFGLLRGKRWVPAMLFSSALFAVVHLLQTPRAATGATVHWLDGFKTIVEMFSQQSDAVLAAATVVNLTLCGMILCVAFQRTGHLWFSIALHAAWIFWLKLANAITLVPLGTAKFWGTRKLIDGWAVLPVLLVTFVAVEFLTRRKLSSPPPPTQHAAAA
jgi:membrane protease YdiL (CAAX protease family)